MRARIGELASSRWERCHGDRQSRAKSRESGEIRNLKTVRGALRINDRSIQADQGELDRSGLAWTRDRGDRTPPWTWPPVTVEERPRDRAMESRDTGRDDETQEGRNA